MRGLLLISLLGLYAMQRPPRDPICATGRRVRVFARRAAGCAEQQRELFFAMKMPSRARVHALSSVHARPGDWNRNSCMPVDGVVNRLLSFPPAWSVFARAPRWWWEWGNSRRDCWAVRANMPQSGASRQHRRCWSWTIRRGCTPLVPQDAGPSCGRGEIAGRRGSGRGTAGRGNLCQVVGRRTGVADEARVRGWAHALRPAPARRGGPCSCETRAAAQGEVRRRLWHGHGV